MSRLRCRVAGSNSEQYQRQHSPPSIHGDVELIAEHKSNSAGRGDGKVVVFAYYLVYI